MQQTMDRIRSFASDDNLVDRRIVNKLLVTYLEKKVSQDVLQLMIRMLGFTEDQKRLVLESQRPRALFGLIPRPYAEDAFEEVGGAEDASGASPPRDNLADLWVDFLLRETGDRRCPSSMTASRSPTIAARSSPMRSPQMAAPSPTS